MHAIMKFRMRRRDRYECDVPYRLPLDGKYHMFCSRENKQNRVYKIGFHFDLQKFSMKSTGILTALVVFSKWYIKLAGIHSPATEIHYILEVLLLSWSKI